MQRYFIEPNQLAGNRITIKGDDVHHIRNVMRNRVGDQIICCMQGFDYLVEIAEITPSAIFCHIIERTPSLGEPKVQVTVAQGLPKGEKLEWILQKGTELGAAKFLPFSSTRSIVKIDDKKAAKKLDRWSKIVKEAAEQSHRGRIPEVRLPIVWKDLLDEISNYDLALIAYEKDGQALKETVDSLDANSILLIVGPEGGFSEQEIIAASEYGAIPITLGKRILRTETAAISLLTCVMFAKNELA